MWDWGKGDIRCDVIGVKTWQLYVIYKCMKGLKFYLTKMDYPMFHVYCLVMGVANKCETLGNPFFQFQICRHFMHLYITYVIWSYHGSCSFRNNLYLFCFHFIDYEGSCLLIRVTDYGTVWTGKCKETVFESCQRRIRVRHLPTRWKFGKGLRWRYDVG